MEKLTVCWKNGKITETITDDINWYIHLLRSNKKVFRWYMVEQSDYQESNLDIIRKNIIMLSTN
jgi:hypothetical protein